MILTRTEGYFMKTSTTLDAAQSPNARFSRFEKSLPVRQNAAPEKVLTSSATARARALDYLLQCLAWLGSLKTRPALEIQSELRQWLTPIRELRLPTGKVAKP